MRFCENPCGVMILLGILFVGGGAQAQQRKRVEPCAIHYTASDELTQDIEENAFTFDRFDSLCAALAREAVGVEIVSSSGVLQERAFGWAAVRLYRRETGILSIAAQKTTTISRTADSPSARRLMLDSANDALDTIGRDWEKFLNSLVREETRLRALFGASAKQASVAAAASGSAK